MAAVCVLALAPLAEAQSSPPLVDQYTEQIPTADGPKHSGGAGAPVSGGGGGGGNVLPPAVQAQITQEGGKDAKKLKELATSPALGAPPTQPAADSTRVVKPEGAVSAAVSAVGDGSDGRLIGLLIALLAITAVALGLAAVRRQRSV